jgi:hypothetical protein
LLDHGIEVTALDKIAGFEGEKLGSVYKFTLGRDDLHLTTMGAAINARNPTRSDVQEPAAAVRLLVSLPVAR